MWITFVRTMQMYRAAPALLFVTLLAPIGMLLLFGYVFGGSLAKGQGISGTTYRAYLIPGVFVLVAAMGMIATAASANTDRRSGLTDRFRSLPMSATSVPAGLALAEVVTGGIALLLMAGVGWLVGWRIAGGLGHAVLAIVLLLLFRYVLSWLGIMLGVGVRDEQMLQQLAPLVFGFIMLSNVFTPTALMPSGVRQAVEWNPMSAVISGVRQLFGNAPPAGSDVAWPLRHPVAAGFFWCVALLAIAVPGAVRNYRTPR
jgi:ABC-2 type transport system permease protein